MNEKLPKPILKALASQAPPTAHPSADSLAAYVEHALLEAERESVAGHLAECRECRDVVFLASGVAEEPATTKAGAAAASTRRRWVPRLMWVGTAAAGLLVGGYFVRDRYASPQRATLVASKESPKLAAPQSAAEREQAQPRPSAEPIVQSQRQPVREKPGAASKVIPTTNAHAGTVGGAAAPVTMAREPGQQEAVASAVPPKSNAAVAQNELAKAAPVTIDVGNELPRLAPTSPHVSSFASSADREAAGQGEAAALGSAVGRSLSMPPGVSPWRVDGKGHVEHFSQSAWTRVLAEQPAVFRSVNARGNDVWAGGDGGMLFHSNDGGESWKKVALSASSGPESASVSRIHFSSAQQGIVITSSGTIYTTSDGGATWLRQ
jgi:hypothetical protein